MPGPSRIGYELRERHLDLQDRMWELHGRSTIRALGFLAARLELGLRECLRMQLDRGELTLGGRVYPYYTPLEALRPGRRSAPFYRRMAALLWVGLAERCVELPVVHEFLHARSWTTMLEVGNVLGYWYDLPPHEIVDRYEPGSGIRNEDIVAFRSPQRFDVVVSISTLEHVGFDESPQDPTKFVRALRALESFRKPDGRLFLSVPIGYNPSVDQALRAGEFDSYQTKAVVGDASGRRGYREASVSEALEAGKGILFATRE